VELLERQFPIDETHPKINLRSPSDFALHLSVHVNHLNRAVKENAGKTTTEVILERILQEAKLLLTNSEWNVSEIAFGHGFSETAHFINFFKSHVGQSPLQFRKMFAEKITL
jgi:AraC-like DNA-binding protein